MPQVMIADSYFNAMDALDPQEQLQAFQFTKAFRANPASPGTSLERVVRAKSDDVWSARVNQGTRAILFKDGDTWSLLYVGRHDDAYEWAHRRKVGRHSVTGTLQVVETVETVREVEKIVTHERAVLSPLFAPQSDEYLLSLGVPEDWMMVLREVRDDDGLLEVCEKLPPDVAERLMEVAAGRLVAPPIPVPPTAPVTASPDVQRRFYVVGDEADLAAALNAPLDKWIAFLHPSQRDMVAREFNGPAKVSGSAGTGKTVVALHRARHLARQGCNVLLTSYVTTLCHNLLHSLRLICTPEELSRITVSTVHSQALELVNMATPGIRPMSQAEIEELLKKCVAAAGGDLDVGFMRGEWENVIQAQGITSWAEYRAARRTGRGKALSMPERRRAWNVFESLYEQLDRKGALDWQTLCVRAREHLETGRVTSPYDAVVVDEVQDLGPPELRLVAALCLHQPGNFMVVGDAGQRIYTGGFSLSRLGIEVRGRARVLRINYRTTEQIRRSADRLIGDEVDDMDGGVEDRRATRSLMGGPRPRFEGFPTREAEDEAAVAAVRHWVGEGLALNEIAVFARSTRRLDELAEALRLAGIRTRRLKDTDGLAKGALNLGTMHRAKGLEFKAVLALDCSAKMLPHPMAARGLTDAADRDAAIARERQLLYVVMTRARDELRVTWHGEPSPFLEPLLTEKDMR